MAARKGKIVRIPPEEWKRGPAGSRSEREELLDLSYQLFAELARLRLREQTLLDQIRNLPPMPVSVGIAVLATIMLLALPMVGGVLTGAPVHPHQRRNPVAAAPTVPPDTDDVASKPQPTATPVGAPTGPPRNTAVPPPVPTHLPAPVPATPAPVPLPSPTPRLLHCVLNLSSCDALKDLTG